MTETPQTHTVLVVEDDDAVRRVIVRALEISGFKAVGTRDGFEAVTTFQSWDSAIDCVIVDMSMPGMDGEETLARLRRINPRVPILLASGHSSTKMRELFPRSGFAGYLEKPFRIAELVKAVRDAIDSGPPVA